MIYLNDYISKNRVLFLHTSDKTQALSALIESSINPTCILDEVKFRRAVTDREAILSTGIGWNVAVPHVKTPSVKKFFITIGIFPDGVEWDSIDGKPVGIAFLIAGPDNHEQYLQILAKLSLIIRNEALREALMKSVSVDEVIARFSGL